MSWIERIQSELQITTGDGRQFSVLWKPHTKVAEYNVAEFDFPKVAGTLVKRGTVRGARYDMEFYFQGEDHLEQAEQFELSARDSRPWVISHPYYDAITVQPLSLTFDHSGYNTSKVTGTVVETITEDYPKTTADPVDQIDEQKEQCDEDSEEVLDEEPDPEETSDIEALLDRIYKELSTIVNTEEFYRIYNEVKTVLLDTLADAREFARKLQEFINYLAELAVTIQTRVELLKAQFELLRETLEATIDRFKKKFYELYGAIILSALAKAAAHPLPEDYANRQSVMRVTDTILDMYNRYIEDLDNLQSENGGDPNAYIPDMESVSGVQRIVSYTISNLFTIAMGARQERTIYLEDDSNLIVLAHRLFGLRTDDSSIEALMKNNDIGLNELLHLRKGREIVYYV